MAHKLSNEAFSQNIYEYGFHTFGKAQADKYTDELEHALTILAQTPHISRERSEFIPPVRIYRHKSHQIIYTIETNHILIIRILHKSMDPPRHLPSSE